MSLRVPRRIFQRRRRRGLAIALGAGAVLVVASSALLGAGAMMPAQNPATTIQQQGPVAPVPPG